MVDVEFLQAVRYIEENPDEFASVEDDGVPRTEALNRLLRENWDTNRDWSKRMVRYRMRPEGRGWGVEEGFGLVRLYSSELTARGEHRSRGIELTDQGRMRLSDAEEQMGIERREGLSGDLRGDVFDSDTTAIERDLRQLEEKVDEMNENLERIAKMAEEFDQSETGALDPSFAEQFESAFRYAVRFQQLSQGVLGVDPARLDPREGEDDVDHAAVRSDLRDVLASNGGSPAVDNEGGQAQLDDTIE